MVEDLKVLIAEVMADKSTSEWAGALHETSLQCFDFFRDHGQALLEAVVCLESIPRKQTVDDYVLGGDEQNMDLADLIHMRGWNDCIDSIELARTKAGAGGDDA